MRRFQQKLIIPTASRPLVERADLTARLEQAISEKRVVALAAPAGWGKTTSLALWAGATGMPVAWYAIDQTDSDPALFLDYLLHAARDYVPDAEELIARLAGAPPGELAQIYQAAALAVAAAPEPFALVLDDFHVLSDAAGSAGLPIIQGLLASLAEYAPSCHLVVASRTPPALHGMVRLIAQQRAAVFDYTALQLSPGEVQRLAGVSAGLMLSETSAARLTSQLGGWVTGIVLSLDQARAASGRGGAATVAVALGGAPERQPIVEADTTQVYAYLAEQVIAPLPEEVRIFLEDTSVLDHLTPRRCDTLRERADSGALIEQVQQHGLFSSSRAGWRSYHSLLRDFMRARLARSPERERRLLARAGAIYAADDDLEAAVDCFLAAESIEQAIALLREAVPRFRRLSRQTTLLACFERLATARSGLLPPDMLIAQARVYGDLAFWEHAYLAIQLAETTGADEQRWEAVLVHADLLSIQGDQRGARRTLASVPFDRLPPQLRMVYHMRAGQIDSLSGEVEPAIAALEQAYEIAARLDQGSDPSALADIYDNLGWAYAVRGDRATALRHLKRADACWQSIGNTGRRAMTLNNIGMMQLDEGLRDDARASFATGLQLARATGRRREETNLLCSAADLELAEGRAADALRQFAEAHALAERVDLPDLVEYAAAGALWSAALSGEDESRWRAAASAAAPLSQPLPHARAALAGVLDRSLRGQAPGDVAGLLAEAARSAAALGPVEHAYLQLAAAAARPDPREAGGPWAEFERAAQAVPEPLLARMAQAHEPLLAAMAPASPLAQRLRRPTRPGQRRWRIAALGGFSCALDDRTIELTPIYRALLTRLVEAGPQGLSVDRLWEAVWGEADLSMTALHQALRRLRVQTGLPTAVRDGTCGIWSGWDEIWYDVHELEQTLDEPLGQAAVERASALYRGDFLPGAPPSASYWVETRRAHIQERFLNTLELYATTIESDQPQLALQSYQRILQFDGCREHTAVRLMRLAAQFGNRSLVTSTFEHLTGALRVLGASPGPATAALYRQLH